MTRAPPRLHRAAARAAFAAIVVPPNLPVPTVDTAMRHRSTRPTIVAPPQPAIRREPALAGPSTQFEATRFRPDRTRPFVDRTRPAQPRLARRQRTFVRACRITPSIGQRRFATGPTAARLRAIVGRAIDTGPFPPRANVAGGPTLASTVPILTIDRAPALLAQAESATAGTIRIVIALRARSHRVPGFATGGFGLVGTFPLTGLAFLMEGRGIPAGSAGVAVPDLLGAWPFLTGTSGLLGIGAFGLPEGAEAAEGDAQSERRQFQGRLHGVRSCIAEGVAAGPANTG